MASPAAWMLSPRFGHATSLQYVVVVVWLWLVARTARALRTNIRILDECGFEVPSDEVERGLEAARRFVLGYTWLVHANFTIRQRQYKVRPKRLALKSHRVGFFHLICISR